MITVPSSPAVPTPTQYTYVGIMSPFQKSTTAFPAPVYDAPLIEQSMITILLTTPGERLNRPTFGSNIQSRLFDNTGQLLESEIRSDVISALGRWEPRAAVTSVGVVMSNDADGVLDVINIT